MPRVIKADHVDFDVPVCRNWTDSEGNVISGAGFRSLDLMLTGQSDNPACLMSRKILSDRCCSLFVVWRAEQRRNTVKQIFPVMLTDGNGALVANRPEAIVVTAGDPAAVSELTLPFRLIFPNN